MTDGLRVEGRLDEAIRTGAETVWPKEVERVLRDHPKVADVAVAGRPHAEWGRQVVAFVVPGRFDDPPSLSELRAHTADRIALFKAPKALVLVSEHPAHRLRQDPAWRASVAEPRPPGDNEGPSPGGVGSGLRSWWDRRKG